MSPKAFNIWSTLDQAFITSTDPRAERFTITMNGEVLYDGAPATWATALGLTGFADIAGTEIFEGDLLEITDEDGNFAEIGTVEWREGCYMLHLPGHQWKTVYTAANYGNARIVGTRYTHLPNGEEMPQL